MNAISPFLPHLVLALIVVVVIEFLLLTSASSRITKLNKLLRTFLTGPNGDDLEEMLARCLSESRTSLARCDELESRLDESVRNQQTCLQKIGLVRYDAFGDVSGSQSFSLALLDDRRNGTIITSLLGRNDGRCYGKAVLNGQPEQTLSEEEEDALQMALSGSFIAAESQPTGRAGRRERGNRGRE